MAAAVKLRVALCCGTAFLSQETATQWLTDLPYPTVHTVISMVNKSPENLSFPTELSGQCVHSRCLSTANELCSSAWKLQTRKEAHYKQSKMLSSLQLFLKCCRSKDAGEWLHVLLYIF